MPQVSKIVRRMLTLLAGMLMAGLAAEQAAAQTESAVAAVLEEIVATEGVPGGVLLLARRDGTTVAAATGVRRLNGPPMAVGTRFYAASVGKLAVAAAVLGWLDRNFTALNTPVADWLPPERLTQLPALRTASFVSLLGHTSGLPDYLTEAYDTAAAAAPSKVWTPAEIAAFAAGAEPVAEPGEFSYSNTNYVILGELLERLENKPLAAVLADRVLTPCGMTATTIGADAADPELAHGYETGESGEPMDGLLPSAAAVTGDGSLFTTAADLARLAGCLLRDPSLLSPQMLRAMKTPRGDDGYGLGLELSDLEETGTQLLGHSGYYGGYTTELWFAPATETVLVLFLNGEPAGELDPVALIHRRLIAGKRNGS